MKLNKAAMTVVIAALAVLIGISAYKILHSGDEPEKKYVSVVVEESGDSRWTAFLQGLNQAARDNHVILNVVSTGTFASMEDEAAVLAREMEYGVDGIIVEPICDDTEGILGDVLSGTQSVLVCTDVSGEKMQDNVSADGYRTGQMIADQIRSTEKITEDTEIGILSGNQELPTVRSCLEGLLESLAVEEQQIRWDISESGLSATANLLDLSMEAKPVDILISLDNKATEKAVDYLTAHSGVRCSLYGEGRSEKCIYNVDAGVIRALAVPDEYMMGYESLERLSRKMTYFSTEQQAENIEVRMVTQENLHDQDTVWIAYPAVY